MSFAAKMKIDEDHPKIEFFIKALWRRIQPYKDEYEKDLPTPVPVWFRASTATALLVFDNARDDTQPEVTESGIGKNVTWSDVCEISAKLTEYGELENSEVGEATLRLVECASSYSQQSDEFINALWKEMKAMLSMYEEQTVIELATITPEPETFKVLKWR